MDVHITEQAWLASWRDDINRALRPFLATFESTYGYPPGTNRIAEAEEAVVHPGITPALTTLYQTIHEALLPDIGNGYFIHPLDHVLNEFTRQGPVRINHFTLGVVFGSDGGGILYAASHSGTIYRSRAASRDSDFEPIAVDLRDFLDQLRQATNRFIATGQPGWL